MQRVEKLKKLGVLVEPVKVTLNSSGWLRVMDLSNRLEVELLTRGVWMGSYEPGEG
jgi:hypothetical protein